MLVIEKGGVLERKQKCFTRIILMQSQLQKRTSIRAIASALDIGH